MMLGTTNINYIKYVVYTKEISLFPFEHTQWNDPPKNVSQSYYTYLLNTTINLAFI